MNWRSFLAALFLTAGPPAFAQTVGLSANLDGKNQTAIPSEKYTLIRFTKTIYNTMPDGSVIATEDDFAFVTPYSGIVHFSGQIYDVLNTKDYRLAPLNPSYVVKLFKNARCASANNQALIAGIGSRSAIWWAYTIPVDADDLAAKGDTYRWCIFATAANDGTGSTYIDGDPAHTRIHVSMTP